MTTSPFLTSLGVFKNYGLLYILLMLCDGCWSCINTNLEECQLCSTQDDVPCRIQRVGYLCIPPIPDTDEAWPGTPQSLEADISDIGDGIYRTEFTWMAPYDSSIDSLRGFLMMVHCEDKEMGSIGLARCFFANLSDNTWADKRSAHDVKFKFTCVQSKKHVKVTLTLSSLPRPPNSIRTSISKTITLPGSRPNWNPLIDTEVKVGPDSLPSLKVRFQPLYPGAAAHFIILTKNSQSVNRTLIKAPTNFVIFTHVPSNDNYTIWLRPVDIREQYIGDHFLESKPFNIPVMPQKRFDFTKPTGMDRLQIATVIVVPIVMLITVTSTVIFFCRRRGKFQMFRGVPKSQTNEKLTNDTPNNHQEKISNAMSDPETTTVAVLCSQRNVIVEKVSKLFAKFIKSKSQVLTIDESCSEFQTQAYIQKWRNGQQAYILLILLSDELLDGVDKIKRGLDISKTSGLKLDLPLLNLLMEIDQVTYEHLPPVMLVCVYSGLCARFLELLPNLGQLYSVVDDFDQHKCQLRSTDLEQLFVSLCSGHVSPPVTLSHSSLIGCVQTRLLLAAIQELLHTKGNQSTTPYSRSKPKQPEAIAVDSTTYQCAYRAPSVGRPAYVYRDIVRRGTSCFDNGCVRHNASSHQGVQPLDSRHSTQTCIRVGGYSVHPQIALCESVSGQTDSGFDTMTSSVGIDEAESVPFVVRSKVAANTDQRMKEHTSGQEELALFISPESDEEYDGVSLSQRIVELNERHTTQWSKP